MITLRELRENGPCWPTHKMVGMKKKPGRPGMVPNCVPKEDIREADPKVGTGKKPKGSDRRLYTDENPKDTVPIRFATVADAKRTVEKVKKISKPYARKIQILTVGEQRAKVMGKTDVVSVFTKGKQQIRQEEMAKRAKKKEVDEVAANSVAGGGVDLTPGIRKKDDRKKYSLGHMFRRNNGVR